MKRKMSFDPDPRMNQTYEPRYSEPRKGEDRDIRKFHRTQVDEMLKELYAATALKSLTLYGNPSVRKFIPSTPST